MENTHVAAISATLDLTDGRQRAVCELIRRCHTGRWPLFSRMCEVQRVGDELVELAAWRSGGYAVVRWSLSHVGMRWRTYDSWYRAHSSFVVATRGQ